MLIGTAEPESHAANAPTLEECRDQLSDVIEGWILVHVAQGIEVPAIDGLTVTVQRTS